MLRRIASAFLMVFFVSGIALAEGIKQVDPRELKARKLLIEAFQTTSPYQREVKLKEVLKHDPDNYFALIRLGELEIDRGPTHQLNAIDYLLQAALSQPQRPEAYLALAQTYFQMGYYPEGTDYMMKALAGPRTRLTYEGVCLEGQLYLDTSNYFAAIITYADAALTKSSPWFNDPYLLKKLHEAAFLSSPPASDVWTDVGEAKEGAVKDYWIQYVFAKLYADYDDPQNPDEQAAFRKAIKLLRSSTDNLLASCKHLSTRGVEKLIDLFLYARIMQDLRDKVGQSQDKNLEHYTLPKRFFNFGVCGQEETIPIEENVNLYKVFVEASVEDPKEQRALLEKLEGIRKQALVAVSHIKDPKKRGEALFKWLRENLIVKYDAVDGVAAENVINDKKYLCLSGAILYTLIARDAGLYADGYIRPNHAYSVMYDKDGNMINVETTYPVKETAEKPAGFDLDEDNVVARGTDLRSRAQFEGEVSPLELVSYQFINVGSTKLFDLVMNEYPKELDAVLKASGKDPAEIENQKAQWRQARDLGSLDRAAQHMSLWYPKFYDKMNAAIDGALSTYTKARAIDPFNTEFLESIETQAKNWTDLTMKSPKSTLVKWARDQEQRKRLGTIEEVLKDMDRYVKDGCKHVGKAKQLSKMVVEAKEKEKEAGESFTRQSLREKARARKVRKELEKSLERTVEEMDLYQTNLPEGESRGRGMARARYEYEATPDEIRKEWPRERKFLLTSLKRLEELVGKHPCSHWLKMTLFSHSMNVVDILKVVNEVNSTLDEGNRLELDDIVDELNRVRIEVFDTQPDLASKLSAKLGEVL